MSTILNTNGEKKELPRPYNPEEFTCCIITAEWNPIVTDALRDGAKETLLDAGVIPDKITLYSVPGTVELVNAAASVVIHNYNAVIVLGCVIRGDTPHFDYVCQHTATGIAEINAKGDTPVIFGVLTVNNLQQALDRAGGKLGNKGSEAAAAAISMSNLHIDMKKKYSAEFAEDLRNNNVDW
ncbi:MAG: 6,7-dimethyl-8-ribityllumazine synthase [Muribaculaceae bacterium]|nr:6,7-dimethyl-8-ribityllumazine synthase [Muribaculaceae bacterium]